MLNDEYSHHSLVFLSKHGRAVCLYFIPSRKTNTPTHPYTPYPHTHTHPHTPHTPHTSTNGDILVCLFTCVPKNGVCECVQTHFVWLCGMYDYTLCDLCDFPSVSFPCVALFLNASLGTLYPPLPNESHLLSWLVTQASFIRKSHTSLSL